MIEELIRRDIQKAAEKAALEIYKHEIFPEKFEPMMAVDFVLRMAEEEKVWLNN